MTALQFGHGWVLYLLWLVPAFAVWWALAMRHRRRAMDAFVARHLQDTVLQQRKATRGIWQGVLLTLALLGAMLAAARPQWGTSEQVAFQRGRDIIIALDVSQSMLARDVHPNRLGRAKADLQDLIRDLRGDRAGIVAFRGKAVTLCPLTSDYGFLRQTVESISVDSAPRGQTDIGAGIEAALAAFDTTSGSHRAIVLVTDGEDLSGRAEKAALEAAKTGIPIFAVGLGSRTGATIPHPDHTGTIKFEGQDVISKLDDRTLAAIGTATPGGKYIAIGTASTATTTLGGIYKEHVRKITAREQANVQQLRTVDRFQWFLLPACLLLLATAALSRGRVITLLLLLTLPTMLPAQTVSSNPSLPQVSGFIPQPFPNVSSNPSSLQVSGFIPQPFPSPPGRKGARSAQRLYRLGQLDDAAALYQSAANEATQRERIDYLHNAAAAYYRAGKLDESAALLEGLSLQHHAKTTRETLSLAGILAEQAAAVPADSATNSAARATLFKRSAEAFQATLQTSEDPDLRNQMALALRDWNDAEGIREQQEIAARYGGTPPQELVVDLLKQQREVMLAARTAFADDSPAMIGRLEALAEQQREAATICGPLQQGIAAAMAQQGGVSNQQQLAGIAGFVEMMQGRMHEASNQLRDLDPSALQLQPELEQGIYELWRGIVPYEPLIHEDLRRQTNALAQLSDETFPIEKVASGQKEAAILTHLFAQRFEKEVPKEGINVPLPPSEPPPGDPASGLQMAPQENATTNVLSAADRAKILELATAALVSQQRAVPMLEGDRPQDARIDMQLAADFIQEIIDLLPEPPPQQNQQPQDQSQQPPQQKPDDPGEESPDQQDPPPPDQSEPEPGEDPPPENPEETPPPDESPDDLSLLLMKALEREQEYQEQKRERNRNAPMLPSERDY